MPWETSFNIDEVLERAANVFWVKGYSATSITDLTKGMEINKGSLYNSFGSKKELFKQVLEQFEKNHQKRTLAQLRSLDDPVASIATLFDTVITQSMMDEEKKGNLIINTALELPMHEDDIKEIVQSALGNLEAFFVEMIEEGHRRGVIFEDIEAKNTAKSLVALTVGVRVLARGAFDASGLVAIKSNALKLIGK